MPPSKAVRHTVTILQGYTGKHITRAGDLSALQARALAERWAKKGDYMIHVRPPVAW